MIKSKIKLLSLFTGIGAFEKALTNLKIPFDLVGFSEINEKSIDAYCAIHNHSINKSLGDITKIEIDKIPNFNLMTYGFPCQDISGMGYQKGLTEGEGTRSGLLWDTMKILEHHRPEVAIAENVSELIGKRFKPEFDTWLNWLSGQGYNNYWAMLNSSNYDLAQSRDRVFVISIRQDIDDQTFKFDYGKKTELKLRDFIRKDAYRGSIPPRLIPFCNPKECSEIKFTDTGFAYYRNLYKEGVLKGGFQANTLYSIEGLCPTITTGDTNLNIYEVNGKLSALEAYLLQGFTEEDYNKAKGALRKKYYEGKVDYSHTPLYFQAGNSISVPVLESIFKQLYIN